MVTVTVVSSFKQEENCTDHKRHVITKIKQEVKELHWGGYT